MTTSVPRGLVYEVQDHYMNAASQLYIRVGILLAREKHVHDHIILQKWIFEPMQHESRHFVLKCLYQVRKGNR